VTFRSHIVEAKLDEVFQALADPTRRGILDRLFSNEGQTVNELAAAFADDMTRFGVMKHLGVLENAGLIVTRRVGREKHCYLNPIPIKQIHDRWIGKYAERRASTLVALKRHIEEKSSVGAGRRD
jgi:DNA-binding transcriptional ArsR family regulator